MGSPSAPSTPLFCRARPSTVHSFVAGRRLTLFDIIPKKQGFIFFGRKSCSSNCGLRFIRRFGVQVICAMAHILSDNCIECSKRRLVRACQLLNIYVKHLLGPIRSLYPRIGGIASVEFHRNLGTSNSNRPSSKSNTFDKTC